MAMSKEGLIGKLRNIQRFLEQWEPLYEVIVDRQDALNDAADDVAHTKATIKRCIIYTVVSIAVIIVDVIIHKLMPSYRKLLVH